MLCSLHLYTVELCSSIHCHLLADFIHRAMRHLHKQNFHLYYLSHFITSFPLTIYFLFTGMSLNFRKRKPNQTVLLSTQKCVESYKQWMQVRNKVAEEISGGTRDKTVGVNTVQGNATISYFYVCIFVCATLSQWVTLPGHTSQVGQYVVKLSVCDLSKCREFREHNDGAAIIASTS